MAQKNNKTLNIRKVDRSEKSAKAKTASKPTPGKTSAIRKNSSEKAKLINIDRKMKQKAPKPTQRTDKESSAMEADLKKSPAQIKAASVTNTMPSLIRHTKATSEALLLLEKSIELIFKKEFKKARGELATLCQSHPDEIEILARAHSYILICERDLQSQKKIVNSKDQLYTLGVMEHNKANFDTAIGYFRQSLESHPDADYIYYSIAASFAMKGDLIASIDNLKKAIELNEDSRIYAKNDNDFSSLQERVEFAELIGLSSNTENV